MLGVSKVLDVIRQPLFFGFCTSFLYFTFRISAFLTSVPHLDWITNCLLRLSTRILIGSSSFFFKYIHKHINSWFLNTQGIHKHINRHHCIHSTYIHANSCAPVTSADHGGLRTKNGPSVKSSGRGTKVTCEWAGACGNLHTWVGPSFLRTYRWNLVMYRLPHEKKITGLPQI